MCKIKIVDSIMGSGKTTWAFNHMKANPNNNYIYITPYLDEVERVKEQCISLKFNDPQHTGKGKLFNLNKLLSQHKNIASTHALFKMTTGETKQLLLDTSYTLILDEVMDVIDKIEITKDDLQTLHNENLIYEKDNFILWNPDKLDYDGTFTRYKLKHQNLIIDLKELCINKSLMIYKDNILMWNFPTSIFNCFDEVYILTYLFNGQIQKYYFDLHKVDYEFYSINNGSIVAGANKDYKAIKENIKANITVIESKINNIGIDDYTLSKNWYIKQQDNKILLNILRNNLLNYFTNVVKGKTNDNMWTTFKDYSKHLKGKGFAKGFVSMNERATNKYSDKKYLAYTVNRYMQTIISNFFTIYNIDIDQDLFAISELVQWIWRSQIRNNKPITIYIPSLRMRTLLISWLNDYTQ